MTCAASFFDDVGMRAYLSTASPVEKLPILLENRAVISTSIGKA